MNEFKTLVPAKVTSEPPPEPRRRWMTTDEETRIEEFHLVKQKIYDPSNWANSKVEKKDLPNQVEFVEATALTEAERTVAELRAKYNFMVDSAQQNARERDDAVAKFESLSEKYMQAADKYNDTIDKLISARSERDTLRAQVEVASGLIRHACICPLSHCAFKVMRHENHILGCLCGVDETLSQIKGGPDGKV